MLPIIISKGDGYGVKTCSKCRTEKEVDQFYKHPKGKDGLCSWCKQCKKKHSREWRGANPRKTANTRRKWQRANPQIVRKHTYKWRDINPEKIREGDRKWREANPGKVCALTSKRRAQKLQATPRWANHVKIQQIYRQANLQGKVVDHIIPLTSKIVCGLHWEGNMQVLTKEENRQKSNKLLDEFRSPPPVQIPILAAKQTSITRSSQLTPPSCLLLS